jgi:hypothetical protein
MIIDKLFCNFHSFFQLTYENQNLQHFFQIPIDFLALRNILIIDDNQQTLLQFTFGQQDFIKGFKTVIITHQYLQE